MACVSQTPQDNVDVGTIDVGDHGGGTTAADTAADDIVVRRISDSAGISILAGSTHFSSIYFGTNAEPVGANIFYQESTARLTIGTVASTQGELIFNSANQVEAGRFTSSGYLLLANPLSVEEGGTGTTAITDHAVVLGSGTGAISEATVATSGHVLTSNGAGADPSFQAVSGVVASSTAFGLIGRALVSLTSNVSITASLLTNVPWDNEVEDSLNVHDNSTNPTRINMPSTVAVTHIACQCNLSWESSNSGNRQAAVIKNGSAFLGGANANAAAINSKLRHNIASPLFSVSSTDYIELEVFQNSTVGSLNVLSENQTWFGVQFYSF